MEGNHKKVSEVYKKSSKAVSDISPNNKEQLRFFKTFHKCFKFKLYGKACPTDFHIKKEPGSSYHTLFVAIWVEQFVNITEMPPL